MNPGGIDADATTTEERNFLSDDRQFPGRNASGTAHVGRHAQRVKTLLRAAHRLVVPVATEAAGDGQRFADAVAQRLQGVDQVGVDRSRMAATVFALAGEFLPVEILAEITHCHLLV